MDAAEGPGWLHPYPFFLGNGLLGLNSRQTLGFIFGSHPSFHLNWESFPDFFFFFFASSMLIFTHPGSKSGLESVVSGAPYLLDSLGFILVQPMLAPSRIFMDFPPSCQLCLGIAFPPFPTRSLPAPASSPSFPAHSCPSGGTFRPLAFSWNPGERLENH